MQKIKGFLLNWRRGGGNYSIERKGRARIRNIEKEIDMEAISKPKLQELAADWVSESREERIEEYLPAKDSGLGTHGVFSVCGKS